MNHQSTDILVINSGSSSLKFGVYKDEEQQLSGSIDAIGASGGKLKLKDADGKQLIDQASDAQSQESAFATAMQALAEAGSPAPLAIGHRIVHGGPQLREHQRITPEVLKALEQAVHFAPLHDPPALSIIHAAQNHFPQTPQFACFDTAFHSTLPEVAAHYPLPATYWEQGVMRYGFHGLSYESIVHALGDRLPRRTVVAHLGNGASLCAMLDGRSVDTSMGLTPTGGIPMGTRTGDLDPGVLLWLLRNGCSADDLEAMVNHKSGLAGLANGVSDMRALTKAAQDGDAAARLAIDIFTRSIAKTIAGYIVVLGGLDALVFTGGIGENSVPVREQVCEQLAAFGIAIDAAKNQKSAELLSAAESASEVRIIPADEDGTIARHTKMLLAAD